MALHIRERQFGIEQNRIQKTVESWAIPPARVPKPSILWARAPLLLHPLPVGYIDVDLQDGERVPILIPLERLPA